MAWVETGFMRSTFRRWVANQDGAAISRDESRRTPAQQILECKLMGLHTIPEYEEHANP